MFTSATVQIWPLAIKSKFSFETSLNLRLNFFFGLITKYGSHASNRFEHISRGYWGKFWPSGKSTVFMFFYCNRTNTKCVEGMRVLSQYIFPSQSEGDFLYSKWGGQMWSLLLVKSIHVVETHETWHFCLNLKAQGTKKNHKPQNPELYSYNKNCSGLLPFFFFMHSDDKLGISSFESSTAIHYPAFTLSTLTLSLSSFVPDSNCSSYNAIIVIKNNLNHWQHCLVCSRIPCALEFF